MVRRTKEDAQATRALLLDAAERLFHAQGVSRTSLHDIAVAAGTTRGAIYWHFKDKADLFNAMMDRVTLPLEESLRLVGEEPSADPLADIRLTVRHCLQLVAGDERVRRVFDIAVHQVEYVDELRAVKEQHIAVRNGCQEQMESGMAAAADCHRLALPLPASVAARGLHALVDGLLQNWLLDPRGFDLVACGMQAVDVYLRGLGFPVGDPSIAGASAVQPGAQ